MMEISPGQIREHLRRTGDTPAKVADAIAPGVAGAERVRLRARINNERRRLKRAGSLPATPTEPAPARSVSDISTLDAERFLVWKLRLLQDEATDGRGIARIQALRAAREAHTALLDARILASREADKAALSAEDWAQQVRIDALSATEDDLEIYVSVWLDRRGYRLSVSPGGRLHLDRAA